MEKYLDALCVYFWAATSILTSIITFTLYALLGYHLTADVVFTSLALFNVLIVPLNGFPWVSLFPDMSQAQGSGSLQKALIWHVHFDCVCLITLSLISLNLAHLWTLSSGTASLLQPERTVCCSDGIILCLSQCVHFVGCSTTL